MYMNAVVPGHEEPVKVARINSIALANFLLHNGAELIGMEEIGDGFCIFQFVGNETYDALFNRWLKGDW